MSLQSLGWNARTESLFVPHRELGLEPARVAREDRGRYAVLDESGARSAELAGRLRHDARTRAELPAVGDWVALRPGAASSAVIEAVLPRASSFVRKVAGDTTEEQVVAANVDTVFLVSGLDADFNCRRIERYLSPQLQMPQSRAALVHAHRPRDLHAGDGRRADRRAAVGL